MELALCADLTASRLAGRHRLRSLRRCPARAGRHKGGLPDPRETRTAGGDTATHRCRTKAPNGRGLPPPRFMPTLCSSSYGTRGVAPQSCLDRPGSWSLARTAAHGEDAGYHRLDSSGGLPRQLTAAGFGLGAWLTAPFDRNARSACRRLSMLAVSAGWTAGGRFCLRRRSMAGMRWEKARKPRADLTTGRMLGLEMAADKLLSAAETPAHRPKAVERRKKWRPYSDHGPRTTGTGKPIAPHPEGVLPWEDEG